MSHPRYHRVSPKFWSEAKRESWTEDARLLAIYLLTCGHRTTEGLFLLPKPYVSADLGWSSERLSEPFTELIERGFMAYDDEAEVILLTNALKYQRPDNPNQILGAIRSLEELPSTQLFALLIKSADTHAQAFGQALREAFTNPCEGPTESLSKPQALAPAPPLVPPTPADGGGPSDKRNPRAKGTNPRAVAAREQEKARRAALCEHGVEQSVCLECRRSKGDEGGAA